MKLKSVTTILLMITIIGIGVFNFIHLRLAPLLIWAIFLMSVVYLVKGTYNPFIYFNF